MKYYYMLQNARVTAFTVSELFRENQQQRGGAGGEGKPPHTHTQIRVQKLLLHCHICSIYIRDVFMTLLNIRDVFMTLLNLYISTFCENN